MSLARLEPSVRLTGPNARPEAVRSAARGRPGLPAGPWLVAGLGRAGTAAIAALERVGGTEAVSAWDGAETPALRATSRALRRRGVRVTLGGNGVGLLDGVGAVVKAPGLRLGLPLFAEARRRGIMVLDELEVGWRLSAAPLVAITGTNGKSTTASLVVEAIAAATGRRPPLAGNTDFGPPLSAVPAAERGPIVAEVSSYQLEGCSSLLPEVAVLTNVTQEHLQRHGSMAAYAGFKRRLFARGGRAAGACILNLDDRVGRRLAAAVRARGGATLTYGWAAEADYRLTHASSTLARGLVSLETPAGELVLSTQLPGRHNAANVAAATAAVDALGLDRGAALAAIERAPRVPGRLEQLDEGQPFDAIVDFAHTPDGITQSLTMLRAAISGRLIVVLGAVGPADPPMRAAMGRAARALADVLVLTTGSLRGEPQLLPLQGLLAGARATTGARLCVELDRRRAIATGLALAAPGDAVVILGRGPLARMVLDRTGASVPFDDRVVTRELLRELR